MNTALKIIKEDVEVTEKLLPHVDKNLSLIIVCIITQLEVLIAKIHKPDLNASTLLKALILEPCASNLLVSKMVI